jgi:mannosyltransferase
MRVSEPGHPTASLWEIGHRRERAFSGALENVSRHALLWIVVVGAIVRFATLGVQGFWLDEGITLGQIGLGLSDLLSALENSNNPPLYYLLAKLWVGLFGDGEVGLRSFSAVLGTATIPVVYMAARSLSSRRAALVAAALTATNPMLIWYSQEARNYALLIFLAALSFLFFVWVVQGRDVRWLWGWAAGSALALTTHYFALALILPEAAWLLWRRRDDLPAVVPPIAVVGAVGVALLPLATSQRGNAAWIAPIALDDRLLRVPEHFLVGMSVPWPILPGIVIAALGVVVVYALWRAEPSARRAVAVAGGVAVAGALITHASASEYLISRNMLVLWIPLAVALAAALGAARTGWIGPASAAGLCVVGLALAVWTAATPGAQRPDWSALAAQLGPTERGRFVVSQSGSSTPLVEYLDGGRYADPNEGFTTSELAVVKPRPIRGYALGTCWWVALCGGHDLFGDAPRFDVPAEFELVERGATAQYDYRLYRAPEPVLVDPPAAGITVRLFAQPPA